MQKSRAQAKRKQTLEQTIDEKAIEREAIKIRKQKSRAQAKRRQTMEQSIEEKAIEKQATKNVSKSQGPRLRGSKPWSNLSRIR